MCPIPKIACCVLLCSDLTLLMLSWVYVWEHLMSPALFPALCSSLLRLCSSAHPRENRFSVILVMVALRAWKEGNPPHKGWKKAGVIITRGFGGKQCVWGLRSGKGSQDINCRWVTAGVLSHHLCSMMVTYIPLSSHFAIPERVTFDL